MFKDIYLLDAWEQFLDVLLYLFVTTRPEIHVICSMNFIIFWLSIFLRPKEVTTVKINLY